MPLTIDEFRRNLRSLLARSGMSMRQLSAAFGRDPGYVATLLDARRPARARPTPDDLVRVSDATGIPLLELFDLLWGVPLERLAGELRGLEVSAGEGMGAGFSDADRAELASYAAFLEQRALARERAR